MTDQEWERFYAGMMFAAGPRRVAEIMAATPNLRELVAVGDELVDELTPAEAAMWDHGLEVVPRRLLPTFDAREWLR